MGALGQDTRRADEARDNARRQEGRNDLETDLLILANGHVLTCDAAGRSGHLNILVRDKRIAEINSSLESIVNANPRAKVIDVSARLITPGFVNAHMHTESFLLRDFTAGKHLALWKKDSQLRELQRLLAEPSAIEMLQTTYRAAYIAHLKSGTTCVAEFPPAVDGRALHAIREAVDRSGVKAVYALQTWDQIGYVRDLVANRPRVLVNIGREEDYTVYSFENFNRVAKELQSSLVAHIAEDQKSVDITRKNFRRATVQLLRDYGVLKPGTVLVHLNHISRSDAAMLDELGIAVVLCAGSAASKRSGYPALKYLLGRKSCVCVGTDWGEVDILNELKFYHQLPLLIPGIPSVSPTDLVKMATINGATALGLGDEIGSIEVGKSADMVFFSLNDIRIPWPLDDGLPEVLAATVVSHLTRGDISEVMIDGKFVVEAGRVIRVQEEEAVSALKKLREELQPPHPAKGERHATEHVRKKVPADALPFADATDTAEGFEEGFSPAVPPPEQPPAPPSQKSPSGPGRVKRDVRPGAPPELSKDVRRVFGEDEDA